MSRWRRRACGFWLSGHRDSGLERDRQARQAPLFSERQIRLGLRVQRLNRLSRFADRSSLAHSISGANVKQSFLVAFNQLTSKAGCQLSSQLSTLFLRLDTIVGLATLRTQRGRQPLSQDAAP